MHTDEQLIEKTINGCSESFGVLIERHKDKLYKCVYSMTKSDAETEDVLQEAYIAAYTNLSSFRGDSKFLTWLFTIVKNVAISKIRKKKKHIPIDPTNTGMDVADEEVSPDKNITLEERSKIVHSALDDMKDVCKNILILREIEGKEYEEISQILGIPIGTVRSRLHRARTILKEKLNDKL